MSLLLAAFFVEFFIGDFEEWKFFGTFLFFFGADVLFSGAPDREVEFFDFFGEVGFGGKVVGFEETFEVAFGVGVGARLE